MGCLRPTKDLLFGILEPCVYPDRIYESILAFRNSAGPFGHKLGGENKDTLVFLHKKGGVLWQRMSILRAFHFRVQRFVRVLMHCSVYVHTERCLCTRVHRERFRIIKNDKIDSLNHTHS